MFLFLIVVSQNNYVKLFFIFRVNSVDNLNVIIVRKSKINCNIFNTYTCTSVKKKISISIFTFLFILCIIYYSKCIKNIVFTL